LQDALGELHPVEREILEMRFGLDGTGVRTLIDIGEELGLGASTIREIEVRALAKIVASFADDDDGSDESSTNSSQS
jgi:DNA-directed RNA polymerase sigma subunit (sigma70/sigma32)